MPTGFSLHWRRRRDETAPSTVASANRRSPSSATEEGGFSSRLARFTISSTASRRYGDTASISTVVPDDSVSAVYRSSAGRTLSTSTNIVDDSDAESVHTIRARNAGSRVSRSTATYSSTTSTLASEDDGSMVSIQASATSRHIPGRYQTPVAHHSKRCSPMSRY